MPNLQQRYKTEIVPTLMKDFNYTTVMQVPRVSKIVVNIGAGTALDNPKVLDGAVADLQLDYGPETGADQGAQVDRQLQAARRPPDRGQGYAPRRADVGVP